MLPTFKYGPLNRTSSFKAGGGGGGREEKGIHKYSGLLNAQQSWRSST